MQDAGEPDLANVDVVITDSAGNTQTVTTDANGDYLATVPPGATVTNVDETDPDYPAGATQTEGTDPTTTTAVAGANTFTENDGYYVPAQINGHLYIDTNGNGTQDAGEPDLANVDVLVTDSAGNTQTVTTDANGDYLATVPPGATVTDVDETDPDYPAGATQTEGTDPTITTAVAGANTFTENDGYQPPTGTLSGHLYIDTNGNGTQDAGEPDLANVDVVITDSAGNTQTVTSDANGDYSATVPASVNANDTTVDVDETDPDYPTGYTQTEGTDPTTVTISSGVNTDAGIDGYQPPTGTVTHHIYEDTNGNGTQDAGEPDLANVDVVITDSAGNTQTVTTDANGNIPTTTVPVGDTVLDIVEATLPAGYVHTEGTDPTTVIVPSGGTANDVDGYQPQNAVISDYVWNDTNGDGVQDVTENGISGVRVFIDQNNNNIYDVGEPTDVTDANGQYLIGKLPASTYSVLVATSSLPARGYTPTYDLDGIGTPHEAIVPLAAGQVRTDVDFGYQPQDPAIQVTKTISSVTFDSPQLIRITYSILVENIGNTALSNVQVTDNLATTFVQADSFSIVSVVSGTFTTNSGFNGNTNTNLLATSNLLAISANGTITLVVLVDTGGRGDVYTNTAVAQGTPPTGPNVTDSDSIPGPSFIDPAVTKAVDPSHASVGDTVTFTITVFNNGNVGATGVVVTDTLPDNLDYVGATSIDTATFLPRGTITLTPPRTVTIDIGNLGVADVIEITIVTRVNSLGQPPIQNEVLVVSDPPPAGISPDPTQNNVSTVALRIVTPSDGLDAVRSLPATGFVPGRVTPLPNQSAVQAYADLGDLWLEIPSLGVKTPIVGVPRSDEAWHVDWLWEQAGWLQGTAFPTWQGNSVVTGHVYLPNGKPGPFVDLSKLRWGSQVIVHAFGQRYIYNIRTNRIVTPDNLSMLNHEDQAWLTLITCKSYNETSDTYRYRVAARAVLVKVEADR